MSILHTTINPRSAEFSLNRDAMLKQVDALHALLEQVQQGGGAKARSVTLHGVSCCLASALIACWTAVRPSLS